MIVKWVCSDCCTNNLCDDAGPLRCEICGKPRSEEPLMEVDTSIVDTTGIVKRRRFRLPRFRSPRIRWKRPALRKPSWPLLFKRVTLLLMGVLLVCAVGTLFYWWTNVFQSGQLSVFRANCARIFSNQRQTFYMLYHTMLWPLPLYASNILNAVRETVTRRVAPFFDNWALISGTLTGGAWMISRSVMWLCHRGWSIFCSVAQNLQRIPANARRLLERVAFGIERGVSGARAVFQWCLTSIQNIKSWFGA